MEFQLSIAAASAFALLIFIYCLLKWRKTTDKIKPPQPSGSWPLIGHLHLLRGLIHITLGKWADKYGPIFMIRHGFKNVLVVSTPELAKECLGNNDKVFLNRPYDIHAQHLSYKSSMFGFSPYGPHWRRMRKITTVELLSHHRQEMSIQRLEMVKHVKISEVRSAIKGVFDNYQAKKSTGTSSKVASVDMKKFFSDITLNTSVRLIVGKSLKELYKGEEYDRVKKVTRDFFDLGGTFVPADALPFLRWFDIGGYEKAMKKAAKEIDLVIQGWLDEHKSKKAAGQANGTQNFLDIMLDIVETGLDIPSEFDADTIVKSTCLAIILGGTDTTSVTLGWALSLLLNNKEALKKVRAELDTKVGNERQVLDSDLKNLTYLQAIIKETLRLYPAAPLSVPRESVRDCTVKGYHIPVGTKLFVNLYKIHRDPRVWPNPLEFRPERFLTTHKDYDVRGQSYELMPFGSGRRVCPAITFALHTMHFTLANLIHGFDISTPSNEMVDMTEGSGQNNVKASPLEVVLIPRLSASLYNI